LVQKPGEIFLKSTPTPTQQQWRKHDYWRRIVKELHGAYNGICAYYCQYIPFVTGAFMPKSKYPREAYSWQNYRLVCNMMNGRKGIKEDVLDPFLIGGNWFVLDFDTYMVQPKIDVEQSTRRQVLQTIRRLKLNDNICVEGRIEALKHYARLNGNMDYLRFWVPFIAHEITRQGLEAEIYTRFREIVNSNNLVAIN
jgi:hypothetical protein